MPQTLNSPIGEQSNFKGQLREGHPRVCEQLVLTSAWLMLRKQGRITGLPLPILTGRSGGYMLLVIHLVVICLFVFVF